MILPYGRQCISDADIAAVVEVLRSDFLTCGSKVEEFETSFAERVGARFAVAMSSATAALHIAMLVGRIGPGHRIITSPNTFLASANCAAYVGAIPDFADIDRVSYNLDPNALRDAWKPDVRAVVPVAYAGQPCDMPSIAKFARSQGAVVIEDASHAVGSGFTSDGKNWQVGSHPWADMTIFSFHPVKIMTTGEGGMLVTNNPQWAQEARLLRSHGMERQRFRGLGEGNPSLRERGPWYYEMQSLGYNYRITDIQCALGLSQLKSLPPFITRRREIVDRYNEEFAAIPWLIRPSVREPACRDSVSWHLYTIKIDFRQIGKTRTQVMAELKRRGVGTQVLYIPVYLQPWYRENYGYMPGKCPEAESFYARSLSLPLYPAMEDKDVLKVVEAVRAVARG